MPARVEDVEDDIDEEEEGAYVEDDDVLERVDIMPQQGEPIDDEDDEDAEAAEETGETQEREAGPPVVDDSCMGFFAHKDSVYSVHINPVNQKHCVSGDGDDQAHVWDVTDGKELFHLGGHTDTVNNVQYSIDGKFVATGSMDGKVRVFDATTGSVVSKYPAEDGPTADLEWFEWHPKGHVIAAGTAESTVCIFNAVNGSIMRIFAGHLGSVTCGAWTRCGRFLATGGEDGSVFIWSPKQGNHLFHIKGSNFHDGPITSIAMHHTDKILITGSQDSTARMVNYETGRILSTFKGHQDSIEDVAFCKQLKLVATASLDGTLKIWDTQNTQCRVTCKHDEGIIKCVWHPTEPLVYTCGMDKIIRLWDARSGQLVRRWGGHRDAVLALDVSRDGSFVVTGSDDHTCLVFSNAQRTTATTTVPTTTTTEADETPVTTIHTAASTAVANNT